MCHTTNEINPALCFLGGGLYSSLKTRSLYLIVSRTMFNTISTKNVANLLTHTAPRQPQKGKKKVRRKLFSRQKVARNPVVLQITKHSKVEGRRTLNATKKGVNGVRPRTLNAKKSASGVIFKLCKKSCGYFADDMYDGYCSKCFEATMNEEKILSSSNEMKPSGTIALSPLETLYAVLPHSKETAITWQEISSRIQEKFNIKPAFKTWWLLGSERATASNDPSHPCITIQTTREPKLGPGTKMISKYYMSSKSATSAQVASPPFQQSTAIFKSKTSHDVPAVPVSLKSKTESTQMLLASCSLTRMVKIISVLPTSKSNAITWSEISKRLVDKYKVETKFPNICAQSPNIKIVCRGDVYKRYYYYNKHGGSEHMSKVDVTPAQCMMSGKQVSLI